MPNAQPPQSPSIVSIENNFTKGLLTEFTGLNFPENAATDTQNCIYTLIGDVTRRDGFDYEGNAVTSVVNRTNVAVSSYKWNNVGGDGNTQIVAIQVGKNLYFYRSSTSTTSSPLSTQKLSSVVDISAFAPINTFDPTQECQFSDGNGYLFVFHPNIDPVYCTYNAGIITGSPITVQIRDFVGTVDGFQTNARPSSLTLDHQYNLQNQGWTAGGAWGASSTDSVIPLTGTQSWFVGTGIAGITIGQVVSIKGNLFTGTQAATGAGSVVAYSGGLLTLNVFSMSTIIGPGLTLNLWWFFPISTGYINTWFSAEGNYPSNADVWWYFKDSTGTFNPATTQPNVTLSIGNAPRGHYLLSAFNQDRSSVSGISNITKVSTNARPTNGCWFQGRVWYTGINASQQASGDANFYTWSENIYFSQIVQQVTDFGNCYQVNDPTSETLFDLLPSDGGVIKIQGSGAIYKLFPLLNALLVFAANGIWYISGGQSVGFAANDYTIVKLSAVKSLSSTSFVDINGLPIFWNEEGIYQVEPAKQGTQLLNSPLHVQPLEVNPLTVGTILTYYNNIPIQSKKYARGAYNPIDYTVQWCFRSVVETDVTSRYTFDTVLNFNVYNKAFYPYTFSIGNLAAPTISGMVYVSSPGGTSAPNSVFKYIVSSNVTNTNNWNLTFAEENNSALKDWVTSGNSTDYTSYFVTGYRIHGQGQRRFQIPFVDVFNRSGGLGFSYIIQSIWDFASTANSGRWSIAQYVTNLNADYVMIVKRHRLRGRGRALQIKVTSVSGQPFDIMGWSAFEMQNVGV